MHRSPRIYIKTTFSVQKCGSLSIFYDIVRLFCSTPYCCFYRLFHHQTQIWPNERVNVLKTSINLVPRWSHEPDLWLYRVRWVLACICTSSTGLWWHGLVSLAPKASLKNKWTFESRQNTYWSKPSAQITLYDYAGRLLQVEWMVRCKLSRVVCVQVPTNKIFKLSTC